MATVSVWATIAVVQNKKGEGKPSPNNFTGTFSLRWQTCRISTINFLLCLK